MANANPSGLGYAVMKGGAAPEQNIPDGATPIVRADGQTVLRTVMTNGNILDSAIFPGDYPNAMTEAEWAEARNPKPAPKAKAKAGE